MGLLDKLKPQPRWKHADPPSGSRPSVSSRTRSSWRSWPRPTRTSRSAGRRWPRSTDPAALGRVVAAESDAEAARPRGRPARRRLRPRPTPTKRRRSLAAACADRPAPARRSSPRAKRRDAVRADALSRLTDERALGSVARHAKTRGDGPRGARSADRATRRSSRSPQQRRAPRRRAGGVRARDGASAGSRVAASPSSRARSRRP